MFLDTLPMVTRDSGVLGVIMVYGVDGVWSVCRVEGGEEGVKLSPLVDFAMLFWPCCFDAVLVFERSLRVCMKSMKGD